MKDTEFMTAKEKEKVLRQWRTFVTSGFSPEHFTEAVYKHLTLHCSFMAHYKRQGFYDTYFLDPPQTVSFIKQFDRRRSGGKSVEYGMDYWLTDPEYSDINTAMCEVMEEHADRLYEGLGNTERIRDLNMAAKLLRKHGIFEV